MSRPTEPLSAAQIHSVYAMSKTPKPQSASTTESQPPQHSKISFAGREPSHPGSPPPLPESKGKKRRR